MNKYLLGTAPVYKLDGVPAYKAGEWYGQKSNKFDNTRRIIQAVENGIFFPENEPIVKPRRKVLDPGYSKEYVFKPSIRIIKPIHEHKTKGRFEGEIFPTKSGIKPFIQREYDFQKIEKYHDKVTDEFNKMIKVNMLMNKDVKSLEGDYSKEFYQNIANNKILSVPFTKELFTKYKNKASEENKKKPEGPDEYIKLTMAIEKHKENMKSNDIRNKIENFKKDIEYVTSLKEWNKIDA